MQVKVDAVKAAVQSTLSCTPATVVTLKELLLPSDSIAEAGTKANASSKTNPGTAAPKTRNARDGLNSLDAPRPPLLGTGDRTALATHVINATLKSLADAAKMPPMAKTAPCKQSEKSRQTPGRRPLRRSASAPPSPLQPKTPNRATTSPNLRVKEVPNPAPTSSSKGSLATAECARIAFAYLRSVKGPIRDEECDFQLENGMSVLVSRMIALGLHDQALKELRILKRRLDGPKSVSEAAGIENILDFSAIITQHSLAVVSACQMQALKLVAATKKPAHIEAITPFLLESSPSSPAQVLSRLAASGEKEATKSTRQMALLSQTLLSIVPSVSSSADVVAMEGRLSPSPIVAFELQSLAFRTQLAWWKLAGRQGHIRDELLAPFARCMRALVRRQKSDDGLIYARLTSSFEELLRSMAPDSLPPVTCPRSPLCTVYQILASTAHAARQYDDAYSWLKKIKACLMAGSESRVPLFSVSARMLAAALKQSEARTDTQELVREVTASLNGSLCGTVTELNELLDSLSAARRSAVGLVKGALDGGVAVPQGLVSVCKDLILRYPRFLRRWVGTPPSRGASAKQMLQFDQRRDAVMQSVGPALDATLMVLRYDMQAGSSEWQTIDDVLQNCTLLLQVIWSPALPATKADQLGTYHVKISSLYFSQFSELRRTTGRSKETNKLLLQALSRSIDVVKERPLAERDKAQLPTKLEIFADLCREMGRTDDAIGTLRCLCSGMSEEGILAKVATDLTSQPPAFVWSLTEKASSLSRALRAMVKLDRSWTDWTLMLVDVERAAVLEHLLPHLGSGHASPAQPLRLHDAVLTALLRIYALEKHPIRRLRVLLFVLYQNIGDEAGLDELAGPLDQALQQVQRKDRAEDGGLGHFVPHLEAYHVLAVILAGSATELPSSAINDCLSSWKTMAKACQSKDEIYAVIDNPGDLINHLQSLYQLAGLRGDSHLQLSVSELSMLLAQAVSGTTPSAHEALVFGHSQVGTQYVNMGRYAQAAEVLERARVLVGQGKGILSPGVVTSFHLAQAEYHCDVGAYDEARKCVSRASDIRNQPYSAWASSRSQATVTLATIWLLQSAVSLKKGDVQDALTAVKTGVRMLSHDWAKLEATASASGETSVSETNTASTETQSSTPGQAGGPRYWCLAAPLLRSLLQLSSVYAHIGMFQETVYYAQSAAKVAEGTQSVPFRARVAAWFGSVYAKASMKDQAISHYDEARQLMPRDACSWRVRLAIEAGDWYSAMGDQEKAGEYLQMAEEAARQLGSFETGVNKEESQPDGASTRVTRTRKTRTGRPAAAAAATATAAQTVARTTKRVTSVAQTKTPPPSSCQAKAPTGAHHSALLTAVLVSRAVGLVCRGNWASAMTTLEQAARGQQPKLAGTPTREQVAMARSLIGQSMELMVSDPVFSVMQDSTISLPAVRPGRSGSSSSAAGRGDDKAGRGRSGSTFAEALRRAQELLLAAHASALSAADSAMVHGISTLLQSTVVLLSAAAARARPGLCSGIATVAVDVGRNEAWAREKLTLRSGTQEEASSAPAETEAAAAPPRSRRHSRADPGEEEASMTDSFATFSSRYIDALPANWSVVSLSLSDSRHDLCISKLQAGYSPFLLRLPLERASSRDANSDAFSFEHGHAELQAIVQLANETSHSARDLRAKGERSAWWARREQLDARLGDLLATMETTWLGGFRGIFSQHRRRPDLLACFQARIQQILDADLPSRTRGGRRRPSAAVALDPRILELFIGLGDPSEGGADYEEALNDLLYFVVDVLQFHGECNAYDEIEFDAMLVKTCDALRGYYAAARSHDDDDDDEVHGDGSHTVLVLDKALHAFPWESLPCMESLSVSRVPSLACLGQLLAEARAPAGRSGSGGHHVSARRGTYILNPSSDLANTQAFFQRPFAQRLTTWQATVRREPTEAELTQVLEASDILLYFGHGSGAQYIRGRTVRRLRRCRPTTWLMGCCSAALTAAGGFECYGPVWNFLIAGCPAVVGTLWDVTDRDIDRFAGRAFEEWGLLPRGTFAGEGAGAGAGAGAVAEAGPPVSLPEAVARARAACRLKYLNAAAVVVYGIPVYVSHDKEDENDGAGDGDKKPAPAEDDCPDRGPPQ